MRLSFVLGICVLLFLWSSCWNATGSVVNTEQDKYENRARIVQRTTKELPLDSVTSHYINFMQYVPLDSGAMLLFINEHNNAIYCYDYVSAKLLKRIVYDREGPNGTVGIQGFLYHNADSIFLYSYNTHILYLANDKGRVLERYKLYERPDKKPEIMLPDPYVTTACPIKKWGDKIICMGFIAGEYSEETITNRPVCCVIDLRTKAITHGVRYPQQYAAYHWGGGFGYRHPYFDVKGKELLVSFSADHRIITYDLSTMRDTSFYAGSTQIKEIRSFDSFKDVLDNQENVSFWYKRNPSYDNIMYDKYRSCYYRIARLPDKNFVKGNRGNRKPVVVIVLDENLRYIGEVALPTDVDYSSHNRFVSREGLNMQVRTENEDLLTFHVYEIGRK